MSADAISTNYVPLETAAEVAPKGAASQAPGRTAVRWRRGVLAAGGIAALAAIAATMLGGVTPAASATHLTHTIARNDLQVIVTEQGTLESANNKEFKCKVKGGSTIIWVIENGTHPLMKRGSGAENSTTASTVNSRSASSSPWSIWEWSSAGGASAGACAPCPEWSCPSAGADTPTASATASNVPQRSTGNCVRRSAEGVSIRLCSRISGACIASVP